MYFPVIFCTNPWFLFYTLLFAYVAFLKKCEYIICLLAPLTFFHQKKPFSVANPPNLLALSYLTPALCESPTAGLNQLEIVIPPNFRVPASLQSSKLTGWD